MVAVTLREIEGRQSVGEEFGSDLPRDGSPIWRHWSSTGGVCFAAPFRVLIRYPACC